MADKGENRINLEDNSDSAPPKMSEEHEQGQGQSKQSGGWMDTLGKGATWTEETGNAAGDWVQDKLHPVGQYTGKGLEQVGKPLGGIIDPTVGAVMRGGEAFGNQLNVGYGNKEGGPAKQQEAEGERMKQPIGGEEQNAENPLGLNRKS